MNKNDFSKRNGGKMNFISWNIDSINAAVEHKSVSGEMTWEVLQNIALERPDVLAIQETKLKATGLTKKQETALDELFTNYYRYLRMSTGRSGYSGTMMLTRHEPLSVDMPVIGAPVKWTLKDGSLLWSLKIIMYPLCTHQTLVVD